MEAQSIQIYDAHEHPQIISKKVQSHQTPKQDWNVQGTVINPMNLRAELSTISYQNTDTIMISTSLLNVTLNSAQLFQLLNN